MLIHCYSVTIRCNRGKRRLFIGQFGCKRLDDYVYEVITASREVDKIIPTGLAFPLMTLRGINKCV